MQVVVREVVHHIVQHPPNHLVRLVQRWVQRVFVAGFEDVGVMRGMTVAVQHDVRVGPAPRGDVGRQIYFWHDADAWVCPTGRIQSRRKRRETKGNEGEQ